MGCCVLKVASPLGFRQWYDSDLEAWTPLRAGEARPFRSQGPNRLVPQELGRVLPHCCQRTGICDRTNL